jgi:hypothetical protein
MDDQKDSVDLEGLYVDREPPRALEERVTADYLRTIRGSLPRRAGWLRQVASGVVLFGAGFGSARALPSRPTDVDTRPSATTETPARGRSFMLLLFERPDFGAELPPGTLATQYAAWARSVAATGVQISGHELALERAVLAPAEGVPGEAAAFRLGGYFVVEAADEAAARRIAESHPHMGHGGWIEVAELR